MFRFFLRAVVGGGISYSLFFYFLRNKDDDNDS